MAGRQKVTVTVTKTRTRKTGPGTGYKKCGTCNGTGRVKVKK